MKMVSIECAASERDDPVIRASTQNNNLVTIGKHAGI